MNEKDKSELFLQLSALGLDGDLLVDIIHNTASKQAAYDTLKEIGLIQDSPVIPSPIIIPEENKKINQSVQQTTTENKAVKPENKALERALKNGELDFKPKNQSRDSKLLINKTKSKKHRNKKDKKLEQNLMKLNPLQDVESSGESSSSLEGSIFYIGSSSKSSDDNKKIEN